MKKPSIITKAYFWNMLSVAIYGSMSFSMTLAVTRLCGEEVGGVFSIAFSSSAMLQTVAMFGMRNYQATDVTEQFKSGEYVFSRIITSFVMAIVCGAYAWFMRFDAEKRIVFLLFCGVRLFEALADVMEGIIHQKNRLDIASQSSFFRAIFILTGFIGAIFAGWSLVTASFLALLMAVLGFFLCACPMAYKLDRFSISLNFRRVGKLLLQCLPLVLSSIAYAYIGNASKISIDLIMDDQAQAQYAIISMPAFAVNMASSFIFRPQLNTMARYYMSKEKNLFRKMIRTMTLIIVGLTFVTFVGVYLVGIPVLRWIYRVDISEQKNALLLIVLCGSFCALMNLLGQALTVIRRQYVILLANIIVAVIIAIISNPLVKCFGILGAAMLYSLSMLLLVFFLGVFCINYINKMEQD